MTPRKHADQLAQLQHVIDDLLAALIRISAQTFGYDEYSHIGGIHEVAHAAIAAYRRGVAERSQT